MTHAQILEGRITPPIVLPPSAPSCATIVTGVLSRGDKYLDITGQIIERVITVWLCPLCKVHIVVDDDNRLINHYPVVPIPIRAVAEADRAR